MRTFLGHIENFFSDLLNFVVKDLLKEELKIKFAETKATDVVNSVINEALKENFEIIYFYAEVPDRDLDKIAGEMCEPLFEKMMSDLVEFLARRAILAEKCASENQKKIVENTIRDEITGMVSASRRLVAQTKMLVCDDLRTNLIDQIVIDMVQPMFEKAFHAENIVQTSEKTILDDVITDLVRNIAISEIEQTKALDSCLSGSWVSNQPDFSYLSAGGRRLLASNKLTEQEIFRKISINSLKQIGFLTNDMKIVTRWWERTAGSPKKSSRFSIASILGNKEEEKCEENVASGRRKSILDEIRDLQEHLQNQIGSKLLFETSKTPQGQKSVHKSALTPKIPTPGKEFPKTPATPTKTPKDYRSDFQKELPVQPETAAPEMTERPSPDLRPSPIPDGAQLTPPEAKLKDVAEASHVGSLLDLPMPMIPQISLPTPSPAPAKKKVRREKVPPKSKNEDIRKSLKNRAVLEQNPVKRPKLCSDRVHVPIDDGTIRLVDNYRLDAIIGEGTFGQERF